MHMCEIEKNNACESTSKTEVMTINVEKNVWTPREQGGWDDLGVWD